ncbi:MaoC family dehydratase [Neobacillus sp. FSL H8-0543]|uniref:MaoC family dehydratase n=1 Tax=Neobacillus sp. FSL H8-0543 TaxID=2954672 RepID=UPI0031585920
MTLIEKVAEHFKASIGQKNEEHLGIMSGLMIQRYALAIGDDNPLYHDQEYARQRGYADIIAPPNMVASIMDWTVGLKEEDLHEDGTPKTGGILPPSLQGVRVMGGGEMKKFYNPIVAGTDLYLTTEVIDTHVKEGKKGLIAFLVLKNTYKDEKEKIYCISERTVIAR